jgi:AcrR family transcriptional regulator
LAKRGDREDSVRGLTLGRGSRLRQTYSPTPRHSVRATRTAGQKMRSRLLDVASVLFKAHGLNGTSMTAIAGAADAFPSQVTYYFRTKEALFVEAACRGILHIAERVEKAAARARTPKAYTKAVVDSLMGADGLVLFVEALILARQRPDLIPEIARTIDRLHVEAARAYAGEMARHGWHTRNPPTSLPAGSGRSRSEPHSRAMPWVGARRRCPTLCWRRWVSWVRRVQPSLPMRQRFGS